MALLDNSERASRLTKPYSVEIDKLMVDLTLIELL